MQRGGDRDRSGTATTLDPREPLPADATMIIVGTDESFTRFR
ncbi:MAG: hypothetical protein ACLFVZ_10430 [Actinomycetota bacterium]